MKVAIIHDWLDTYAGSERVLEQMLLVFPEADIFCVVDFLDVEARGFLEDKQVKTSFIQRLPFSKTKFRHYLGLMPLAIEQLDVTGYDLVLSSSHAVAKGVLTGPGQVHISYVHTPIRYAWDFQHQYLQQEGLDKGLKGVLAKGLLHYMRSWDYRSANGVDYFISNSDFIARRIWKVYRREAETIYPPVNVEDFSLCKVKEDFYVTASRLVPYKKVDIIVEAFKDMPDKTLFVIGDGPMLERLKKVASPNVVLMGYQSFSVLKDFMQRAKAFVFAAEEDFGISPVEAQACGTPVIAFGRGGALETVKDVRESSQPTGLFFYEQTAQAIVDAVKLFEEQAEQFVPNDIRKHALQFSAEQFRLKLEAFVTERVQRGAKEEVTV